MTKKVGRILMYIEQLLSFQCFSMECCHVRNVGPTAAPDFWLGFAPDACKSDSDGAGSGGACLMHLKWRVKVEDMLDTELCDEILQQIEHMSSS